MLSLILLYCLGSLFWCWILRWGGAEWLEGWRSIFFISWLAGNWNAEQIKFYAVLCWILQSIALVLKLIWN